MAATDNTFDLAIQGDGSLFAGHQAHPHPPLDHHGSFVAHDPCNRILVVSLQDDVSSIFNADAVLLNGEPDACRNDELFVGHWNPVS